MRSTTLVKALLFQTRSTNKTLRIMKIAAVLLSAAYMATYVITGHTIAKFPENFLDFVMRLQALLTNALMLLKVSFEQKKWLKELPEHSYLRLVYLILATDSATHIIDKFYLLF
jgi:hypothetical protein